MLRWILCILLFLDYCAGSSVLVPPLLAESHGDLVAKDELLRRINTNKYLTAFPIDARVSDGIVQLQGEVPHKIHQTLIAALAANISGIRAVQNKVRLMKPETSLEVSRVLSEAQLLAMAVQIRLYRNTRLFKRPIFIDVNQSTILLSGKVSSLEELQDAERIAQSLPEVQAVVNILSVE